MYVRYMCWRQVATKNAILRRHIYVIPRFIHVWYTLNGKPLFTEVSPVWFETDMDLQCTEAKRMWINIHLVCANPALVHLSIRTVTDIVKDAMCNIELETLAMRKHFQC